MQQNNGSNNGDYHDLLKSSKLQQIFQLHKNNACNYEGTKYIFQIIDLANAYNKDSQNKQTKQKIEQKLEISQQQIEKLKQQSLKQFEAYRFDINKMFMSNKSGGLGMIERKCKFTQKGVLEYENQKSQPKLKEIIDFKNVIEIYNAKSNPSKLSWVKQHAKHPFRIILIDKNKAQKGVYFINPDDAFTVRVYLIQKYKAKVQPQRIKQIFQISTHLAQTKTSQGFAQKLLQWKKHQPKDRKPLKGDNSKQNEIKLFGDSNNEGKFNENHFDVDRDSHPLSQYYFGEKKQFSSQKGIAYDSRSEFGFKKSPTKIKQIQKINETNKKFVPYGLVEKLKRYNKANVQDAFEKWRQYVKYLNEKKLDIIITGETQLSNVMNSVAERELSSKRSKKLRDSQKSVLRFDHLKFRVDSVTLIAFKFELEVSVSKLRGPAKEIVYTTFQSIDSQQDSGSVVYELIKLNEGETDGRDDIGLQLLGGMEKHKLSLRLKQKIRSEILGYKEVFLRDITLFNGSFTLDMLLQPTVDDNMEQMNNLNREQMNNLRSCQISGRIMEQHNINEGNKIKGDNYQLMARMLTNIPVNESEGIVHKSKAIVSINGRDMDEKSYYKKLLSNLPVLDDNHKRQLQDLLSQKSIIDAIDVKQLFSFVPIDALSALIPTQQQYQLLGITYKVLEIVGTLKHNPPSSLHLNILRHLRNSQLFPSRKELLETFISIVTNWSSMFLSYHQPNNLLQSMFLSHQQPVNLLQLIGLTESVTSFKEKLSLMKVITQHLLDKQCRQLTNKCKERNISLVILVIDYCNSMMTRNLQPRLWIRLMCRLFDEGRINFIPSEISLVLIAVYICRVANDQLINCTIINDVKHILQTTLNQSTISKDNNNKFNNDNHLTQSILSFINTKYQQYFISQSHAQLQQIKTKFYTRESSSLQQKTSNRHAQKTAIINSLKNIHISQLFTTNNTQNIQLNNTSKCLHLCFVTLPNISGSLYLRTSSTEFQCTQYQRNPYFVLPDINSPIQLEFIDTKSNQYTFELQIQLGFCFFTQQVKNKKNSNILLFQYWAALIDSNIYNDRSYTNSKQLQSSLSSFLTFHNIKQRLLKQPNQSFVYQFIQKELLSKYQSSNSDPSGQQILRKIKIAFASNNKISEYELFFYMTANRNTSLKEKIFSLFQYADHVSLEIFLSISSHNLRRVMLYDLLKVMSMPIDGLQFQSLYQGMMHQWSGCQVPQILKARFICCYEQKLQMQLEKELYQYLEKRSQKYIYYDIDIEELVEFLKPVIIKKLNQKKQILNEGSLKLIISSQGKVKSQEFRVLIRNNNKEFIIDEKSLPRFSYQEQLQSIKPKVLRIQSTKQNRQFLDTTFSPIKGNSYKDIMSDKATSASKIILPIPLNLKKPSQTESNISQSQSRFKDQTKNLKQKYQLPIELQNKTKHHDQSLQQLNLIKFILNKAKKIIPLRYNNKCESKVMFKQFQLFEYINGKVYLQKNNLELFNIDEVYVNNVKTIDLSFLHNSSYLLQFHTNLNTQLLQYSHQIGIQNNLHRIINPKDNQPIQVYFITTNTKSQNYIKSHQLQAKIMINYGYGIIRWEKCRLVGYFEMKRQKPNKKEKKMYLVVLDGKQKIIEENYIKIQQASHKQVKNLGMITQKNKEKWESFMI